MFDDSLLDVPIFDPAQHTPSSALRQERIVTRPEVIRSTDSDTGDAALRFDLTRISATWCRLRECLTAASATVSCRTADNVAALLQVPSDAGVSNTEEKKKTNKYKL
jgi:DNA mismatch repair protein PMS2